ncbi:SHOCT domain-containing protein [Candidatus Saccharibacteria bacterium]|nr:SHOCT domain-containing protein [Candidatus Saccharibacteria bacterium]
MMGNSYNPWVNSWGIGTLLFWVIVIIAIVVLVKWLSGQSNQKGSFALDVLKSRYAKGEITKEEFEAKKKDIS